MVAWLTASTPSRSLHGQLRRCGLLPQCLPFEHQDVVAVDLWVGRERFPLDRADRIGDFQYVDRCGALAELRCAMPGGSVGGVLPDQVRGPCEGERRGFPYALGVREVNSLRTCDRLHA